MSCHRKILTSSRLVHSIDSALDPDNYDKITYLNNDGCWETFVGYLRPKSNKQWKMFFGQVTFLHCSGQQRQCDIIAGGKHSILLERAKHIETIEDPLTYFLMKKCFL